MVADIQQRLATVFKQEAEGEIGTLARGLAELERAPGPARRALIASLRRAAHSLKGAARSVNRTDIESLSRAMEVVFGKWDRMESAPPSATLATLRAACGLLGELLRDPSSASRERIAKSVEALDVC